MVRGFLRENESKTERLVSSIQRKAKHQKMSQTQMGKLIGVSQGRMSQKLSASDLTVREMFTILDALGEEIVLVKKGEK